MLHTLLAWFFSLLLFSTPNFAFAKPPSVAPLSHHSHDLPVRTNLASQRRQIKRDFHKRDPGNWKIPTVADAQYIELPLDHFGDGKGTFKNRYWVYDAAYKPGGPVIIDDGGEDNAENFLETMQDSVAQSFANATNGMVINWEHRFYGASKPHVADASIMEPDKLAEYYKYLTVEQALEDFVTFAKTFKYKGQDMNAGTVPWVFVGGSYPGARAAWLRVRNPEIVHISFASSAPVQVEAEFSEYRDSIFDYFDSHGHKGCMNDIRELITWMDAVVEDKEGYNYEGFMETIWGNKDSEIYNTYFLPDPAVGNNSWDQAKAALGPLVDYVFTGFQDGEVEATDNFCTELEQEGKDSVGPSSSAGKQIESEGLVSTVGLQSALPVIGATFNSFLTNLIRSGAGNNSKVKRGKPSSRNSIRPATTSGDSDSTSGLSEGQILDQCNSGDNKACQDLISPDSSWMYQLCAELGYFFTRDGKTGKNSAMKFETLKYNIDTCVQNFGKAVSKGPSLAPIHKYGGNKQINPSNTFWVDGQYDPWRPATVDALDSGRYPSKVIPGLNKTLQGDNFFGALINNTFHIPLHSCFAQLAVGKYKISEHDAALASCQPGTVEAQQLFLDALEQWLPQFKKHSVDVRTANDTAGGGGGGGGSGSGSGSTSTAASSIASPMELLPVVMLFIALVGFF